MLAKWMMFLASEREKANERPTRPSGPDSTEWHGKTDDSRVTKRVTTQGDDIKPLREQTAPQRRDTTRPTGPTYHQQAMQLRMRHLATNTFYHHSSKRK